MATWLGIDIGATAVKVVVVRTAYRKVQVAALGICEVSAAGGSVSDAIRGAMAAAFNLSAADKLPVVDGAAVALEGAKVAVRQLSLPQSAQKQISEVLPFELESLVPFDIAESVWDWRQMTRGEGQEGQIPLLVAVARTEDVRARIALLKSAVHVEPARVGVGGFPLTNLVGSSPQLAGAGVDGPIIVLDLGTSTSEVLVLKGGEPLFARAVSFGTQGQPASAAPLAREIRTTIAAFRATGGAPPVKLVLCGGGAFVSGAEAFLARELELPVEMLAAPQVEMTGIPAEGIAQLPRFAKALGLAFGLTVRAPAFDLRRGPLAFERGFAWIKEKVPVLAGLGAVVMVSFFFTAWAQLYAEGKDRDTLEAALTSVTKDVLGEQTASASRAQDLLSSQTGSADEDPLPHADAFDVMVGLSEGIPESMTHDIEDLDVQKGHAVVHGIVGSVTDAQQILETMKSTRCFQDAKITRTDRMVGSDRQKYVMEFDIKCPEDQKGARRGTGAGAAAGTSSAGGK
jgi:general secretion pathway protein L